MKDHHRMRAWSKAEKSYLPIKNIWLDESGELVSICPQYRGKAFKASDWIIELCTGLKDKNGKLIYEGDKDSAGNVVEYLNGCFCLNGDRLLCRFGFVIAGNIHENPSY